MDNRHEFDRILMAEYELSEVYEDMVSTLKGLL